MLSRSVVFIFLLIFCGVIAKKYDNFDEPVLQSTYHGLVKENDSVVEVVPIIAIDKDLDICDFQIVKKKHMEIPFKIQLTSGNRAVLTTKRSLNCEKRKNYKFEIVAVFCNGQISKSATIHITVVDINEYSPTFLEPSYVVEVDEGRLYSEIIRVEAIDRDCTPRFGDVCKYEILTSDQPFTIDNEGSIRNTEPLDYARSHNHILSVVAFDCSMKQSQPVMVSVKVNKLCEATIKGIADRIDFSSNDEKLVLFPNAKIKLCGIKCDQNSENNNRNYDENENPILSTDDKNDNLFLRTTVTLKTKHIGMGCDRDFSKCPKFGVDLLPANEEFTKHIPLDEGSDIYSFDGETGVQIPDNVINHRSIPTKFSISAFVKKNIQNIRFNDKHVKEHIVCSADDHKMNRHHFALFIRNCRLILLLRKDFNNGDLNIFRPAEWRFKIPQVCDGDWHHYVVNVDFPKVELYIDGRLFETVNEGHSNPEVIDDWPLHLAQGVDTVFSVGACWQGSENKYKHGFNGYLSKVNIVLNNTLTKQKALDDSSSNESAIDVIDCLNECSEHLILPNSELLEPNTQIQANRDLTLISIEGHNLTNIELLLKNIAYKNNKKNFTIGRRNLNIDTELSCKNNPDMHQSLPTIDSYVMLQKPIMKTTDRPVFDNYAQTSNVLSEKHSADKEISILVSGDSNQQVNYQDIKRGVRVLANISVAVLSKGHFREDLQSLDSCVLSVFPALNPDHETIKLILSNLQTIHKEQSIDSTKKMSDIKTESNKDGVKLIGFDSIENYKQILSSIVYTNKKPAYYLNRVFKLFCSNINGEITSNEHIITLTVIHPKQKSTQHTEGLYAHAMIQTHEANIPETKIRNIVQHTSSHATTLIIVICCSFVLLLVAIATIRIRNNKRALMGVSGILGEVKDSKEKLNNQEQLVWDDSALTITVNPMQVESARDSSDSESSDSESDDEDVGEYRNVSQLEWDHSNM